MPHQSIASFGLCRDCLGRTPPPPPPGRRWRCRACGGPRVVTHPELDQLTIAHIDCDAFYASVEKRDRPELADQPVIIGGGKRGVVSTACYVARMSGVRSAMPMFQALKLCPDAVVIRPDMARYVAVGRQIRAMMRELTPLVEPLSIDEAFLDLAGTERLHHGSPAESLARLAQRIETEVGVTVSVGLSYNKFLAKVASDLDKPRGFSVIGQAEAVAFLGPKPVSLIHGVGAVARKNLESRGYRLISDLRAASPATLASLFGKEGLRLSQLAHGVDHRKVTPERPTKSISAETTLEEDIADLTSLEPLLWRLCEKVSSRLKAANLATAGVTLKLKTADFRLVTRTRAGFPPTQLARRLYEPAHALLQQECAAHRGRQAWRLLGVGASDLKPGEDADQGDLADQTARRDASAEHAIDALRSRFGDKAVFRGISLRHKRP
ncbi:DNA polymerase IV [Camelimonas lactis]|uniref:DNA polymerase IV n=1 Tax=Camelimonas lactis TaxID=659006 RepID=A0A4R2GTV9_9HYPH|nr:DNA polymerase IV [Camelimonas lactis]TCO13778.1 DNA polymerase-4 [Camelimonas lactis]